MRRDADHLEKDREALTKEVIELKTKYEELKDQSESIEKEIEDYEKHNKILYEQNVKLTQEIDELERRENKVRVELERRPYHRHLHGYDVENDYKRHLTYSESSNRETSYRTTTITRYSACR